MEEARELFEVPNRSLDKPDRPAYKIYMEIVIMRKMYEIAKKERHTCRSVKTEPKLVLDAGMKEEGLPVQSGL